MLQKRDLDFFLSDLSDKELLLFAVYRYDEFLENSKSRIKEEIKKRGLKRKSFDAIVSKKNKPEGSSDFICTRCNSSRYVVEKDILVKRGTEIELETLRCKICSFNAKKTRDHGVFARLMIFFGFRKDERYYMPKVSNSLFE